MDVETIQAASQFAESVTIAGILIAWITMERRDNDKLWEIIFQIMKNARNEDSKDDDED